MHLRDRTPQDLPELAAVGARVRAVDGYPVYLPRGDHLAFLTSPVALAAWVAEGDDGLAGHVALNATTSAAVTGAIRAAGIDGDLGVVSKLLVDPVRRRHGVAALLLDRARRHADELGRVPVLDVIATSAAPIARYRREGWIELGRVAFTFPDGLAVEELVFRAPSGL